MVVRAAHPLRGKKLRVAVAESRRDGFIQVVLPDGKPSMLPVAWTDLGTPDGDVTPDAAAAAPTLDLVGLRRLMHLVQILSAGK